MTNKPQTKAAPTTGFPSGSTSGSTLSHIASDGMARIVDVSLKPVTLRTACARARVTLGAEILSLLSNGDLQTQKGPVFQTAILAGTMAAKKTGDLIPLCHPLGLEDCQLTIKAISADSVEVQCTTRVHGKTGVEMEALTGASVAALTIYDMCKAMSHAIVITETRLLSKNGGKNTYEWTD